jgi:O-antigen/teichoic acid export membrane protein
MQLFGSQFTVGAEVLKILAIGQFINVVTGPVGYLLMMSGNERLMRNNIIVSTVICIILNSILIQKFGIFGGAIATAFCLALMNIISTIFVWNRLGITTLPFFKRKFAKASY